MYSRLCVSVQPSGYKKRQFSIVLAILCVALFACSDPLSDQVVDENNVSKNFVKGDQDYSEKPIDCGLQNPFVRPGSFASFDVKAYDEQGQISRYYQLSVSPPIGNRVIQNKRVIFDTEGQYQVSCCLNDESACDQVAIQVGALSPALSVAVDTFAQDQVLIKGRATSQDLTAAKVLLNQAEIDVQEDGTFETMVQIKTGLNRFELIAYDDQGRSSTQHAWTIGGPFNQTEQINPQSLRLALAVDTYDEIAKFLEAALIKNIEHAAQSESFRKIQTGSSLGYQWKIMPKNLHVTNLQISLTPHEENLLAIDVSLPQFVLMADADTRFGGGDWRQRTVQVSADLDINIILTLDSSGVVINSSQVEVHDLNVDISDMPRFIEGILTLFFKGELQKELTRSVELASDQGLHDILTQFTIEEKIVLPEPLAGELNLVGQVSHLQTDQRGLQLGLGLALKTDYIDPSRQNAPGPLMSYDDHAELKHNDSYELSFHIDLFNRIFFAAWQSAAFDLTFVVDDLESSDPDSLVKLNTLTLFVTPELPPVLRVGDATGELVFEWGKLRVDAVLDSDLGAWNTALMIGGQMRSIISGGEQNLTVNSYTDFIEADILIAPAHLEKEPVRRLLSRVISTDVMPKYASFLQQLPLAKIDLESIDLPGIIRFDVGALTVDSSPHSLSIASSFKLITE